MLVLTETKSATAERVDGHRRSGAILRRDRLGTLLLALSAAGLPLAWLALRRLGRLGGLLLEAGCGVLFVRDAVLAASGASRRLRPVPALLLFLELAVAGVAILMGCWTWVWRPFFGHASIQGAGGASTETHGELGRAPLPSTRWAVRANTAAVAAVFVLHTVRMAIYLGPTRGLRADVTEEVHRV